MDSAAVSAEQWITSSQIIATMLGIVSAVLIAYVSAFLTYKYTRRIRLEAEWRIDKLKHYKQFLDSITEVMSAPESFNEVHKQFACACNAVLLIAPQEVTDLLFEYYLAHQDTFHQEMTDEEERKYVSDQKRRLKLLVLAIRKDMRITPSDNPETFQYMLRSPTLVD